MWGNFTCLIIDEILREKQSSVCFDLWNFQEIDLFQCLNEKRSSSGKLSLLHDRLVAEFVLEGLRSFYSTVISFQLKKVVSQLVYI